MSIDLIKQELAGLDSSGRTEIVAYLLALGDQEDKQYKSSLTRKIDDKNPTNWATLEELDRRLSIDEKAE